MLTELELSKKRAAKNLRQRRALRGRRTAGPSKALSVRRYKMRLDADELAKRNAAYEAAREKSRAPIKRAEHGGNFLDKVKAGLRSMLPRRTGGAD